MECIQLLNEIKEMLSVQSTFKKKHLTFKEASIYLGLSKSYLYKLTSKKDIPHSKPMGKVILFVRKELDEWVRQGKVPTNSEVESHFVDFLANSKNQSK